MVNLENKNAVLGEHLNEIDNLNKNLEKLIKTDTRSGIDCLPTELCTKSEEKQGSGKMSTKIKLKTYPADCRKIAAIDSNKHDWD